MANLSKYSTEQLLAEKKRRQGMVSSGVPNQAEGGQVSAPADDINALILQALGSGKSSPNGAQAVANAYRTRAGLPRIEQPAGNDLNDLIRKALGERAVENLFPEEKSDLEKLIEQGKAAEAAKLLGNRTLFEKRTGNQRSSDGGVPPAADVISDQPSQIPEDFERDEFGKLTERGKIQAKIAETTATKQILTPIQKAKMLADEEQQKTAVESLRQDAQSNLDSIRAIKEKAKYFGRFGGLPTAATGEFFSDEYGERKKWENEIKRLLASKMLEKMGELKRMSKTGSTGLGQLTEKEGQTLRDASTALSRDLPADKALEYLNDMERIYEKLLNPPKLKGSDSSGIQERSIPQKTIGRFIVEEVD